ncbi:hypothetical protein KKC97_03695 [bacterium]|nr:hypothetical protein [bacterium]MBU1636747.1 hypothetical protein [bacterium]
MLYFPLSRFFAKWLVQLNPPDWVLVMCRGYNEDYENFTELDPLDDKDLDFYNEYDYPEFQLWISNPLLKNWLKTILISSFIPHPSSFK